MFHDLIESEMVATGVIFSSGVVSDKGGLRGWTCHLGATAV